MEHAWKQMSQKEGMAKISAIDPVGSKKLSVVVPQTANISNIDVVGI